MSTFYNMTLLETIKLLEYVALQQPNINGIVESGDIFDLNKDEYQQKYSAFCVTQNTHTVGLEFTNYSFTLFYVDRLTLDESNKLQIQSSGVEFFANLIKTIMTDYPDLNWESGDVTTFTQKFSAECAGAYMTVNITTPNTSLCPVIIDKSIDYSTKYFSIESLEDENIITIFKDTPAANIEYYISYDGNNWTQHTGTNTFNINKGEKIMIKASTNESWERWRMTGIKKHIVNGNIMSLLYGDDFLGKDVLPATRQFNGLFATSYNLTDAGDLKLPATNLTDDCYRSMFYYCQSLTKAPELPATTLANYCYAYMFYNCNLLNYIKCLAEDITATDCTKDWVQGVATNGTFIKATSMTDWTDGYDGIPTGWDVKNV